MSRFLHSRKFTLQAKLKNVKPHHRDSNQGPSAYGADALTIPGLHEARQFHVPHYIIPGAEEHPQEETALR